MLFIPVQYGGWSNALTFTSEVGQVGNRTQQSLVDGQTN